MLRITSVAHTSHMLQHLTEIQELIHSELSVKRGGDQGLPAIPPRIHSMLSVTYFPLHKCRSQPTVCPGAGMSRKCLVH